MTDVVDYAAGGELLPPVEPETPPAPPVLPVPRDAARAQGAGYLLSDAPFAIDGRPATGHGLRRPWPWLAFGRHLGPGALVEAGERPVFVGGRREWSNEPFVLQPHQRARVWCTYPGDPHTLARWRVQLVDQDQEP